MESQGIQFVITMFIRFMAKIKNSCRNSGLVGEYNLFQDERLASAHMRNHALHWSIPIPIELMQLQPSGAGESPVGLWGAYLQ